MRLLRVSVTSCMVVANLGLGLVIGPAGLVFVSLVFASPSLMSQDLAVESWKLESRGDGATAREQLRRAAENAPSDPLALESYAVFLDRHRDPEAREVYQKLSDLLARNRASASERARIARRLVTLDLIAGNREAAARHLEVYRSAGGASMTLRNPRTAAFVRADGGDFTGRGTGRRAPFPGS
jgi:Flp pilus assembly protein TadD